jgi:hypothetical protein
VISTRATVTAWSLCSLSRFVQILQYGFAIYAVGGRLTVLNAFVCEGVQLIGSSAGDLVPGQLGAMEGTYSAFSSSIGLADAPARVLSLVMIVRGALVGLAVFGLLVAALLPQADAPSKEG